MGPVDARAFAVTAHRFLGCRQASPSRRPPPHRHLHALDDRRAGRSDVDPFAKVLGHLKEGETFRLDVDRFAVSRIPPHVLSIAPDREAAIEHGAFRYLVKPVDGKELADVVERAAQLHRLALVRREAATEVPGKLIGDRAGLETRFASGLEKMWIAMQPILSWRNRSVYAYEALLRTDEPTLRSPLDFVDAAERLGRTAELGRTVRRRIADQIAQGPNSANVFVNLHPSDLVDDELSSGNGALAPFASRVVLEVTERAALEQVKGLGAGVVRLRELGFRIALDDLGAGYAGLSSFALLEPEVVKVDMSLVREIADLPYQRRMVLVLSRRSKWVGPRSRYSTPFPLRSSSENFSESTAFASSGSSGGAQRHRVVGAEELSIRSGQPKTIGVDAI